MDGLEEGLLAGKGRKQALQQKRRIEECKVQIKTLRNKNNELQKQCDNQLQNDIRRAIKAQTTFLENQIKTLKNTLEQLHKDYKDPSSKQKIKQLCNLSSKEMERNRRIMAEFVNRQSSYSQYKLSYEDPHRKSRTEFQNILPPHDHKPLPAVRQSNSIVASQDMMDDLKAEQQMQAQRTAEIKRLEEQNNKINGIIKEMGQMIGGDQHDMIEAMGENLEQAKNNLQDANDNLDDAQGYQKKSRKKLICLVTTIIILVVAAAGMIYFLVVK